MEYSMIYDEIYDDLHTQNKKKTINKYSGNLFRLSFYESKKA